MTKNEQRVRNYALHLALQVRKRGDRLVLSERYKDNGYTGRRIGVFRTWAQVERAVESYGDECLKALAVDADD
jgi:hypothetical protein